MGEIADELLDQALQQHMDYLNLNEQVFDTWVQRDGTKIKVVDMTDSHLTNTIKMLELNNKDSRYLPHLRNELLKRK